MAKRAFISFQMEDEFARNHLRNQAKDKRNDLEFVDYSVQDPWDRAWKTECAKRIGLTSGSIVLVGKTTYQSAAVEWEIKETVRQGHPFFGIWIHRDERPPLPTGLRTSSMISWDVARVIAKMDSW